MKKPAWNGLPFNDIGDYERFEQSPFIGISDMRRPKAVFALPGGVEMVRYHLGSQALREAIDAVGAPPHYFLYELTPTAAIFGLVRPATSVSMALFHIDQEQGVARLQFAAAAAAPCARPSQDEMLAALRWLAAPPCWLRGDETTARDLGVVHDHDQGWHAAPLTQAVKVTFVRSCGSTKPELRESVDILVPFNPSTPPPDQTGRQSTDDSRLADRLTEADRRAWDIYAEAAEKVFENRAFPERPAFTLWRQVGVPTLVAFFDPTLEEELVEAARILAQDFPSQRPTP